MLICLKLFLKRLGHKSNQEYKISTENWEKNFKNQLYEIISNNRKSSMKKTLIVKLLNDFSHSLQNK